MGDDLLWRNLKDLPAFRGLLRAVEARFYQDIPLPEPVLDLGCGDAHFASITFDRPLAAGVDPWASPLVEARRRRGTYHLLAQAAGGALPFADGHFAAAISNSVLEHIPNLEPVLRELSRVTRPGAPFVFCVPSDHFLELLSVSGFLRRIGLTGLAQAYERFFNRISRHHHCDSPAVWQARLEAAGFRLERSWHYFSPAALRALEWGHYFGLPALVAHRLTGRWVLAPTKANLVLTDWLLRRYYQEPLPEKGAYLFLIARRL
jgi:SAM-dependent methyltransferase